MLRSKKVVVTGAAGFIGSHICETPLDNGAHLFALDGMFAGRLSTVKPFTSHANYNFVEQSVFESGTKKDGQSFLKSAHRPFSIRPQKNYWLVNPARDLHVHSGGTLGFIGCSDRKTP